MTTFYLDPVNGDDGFDGSTWTPTTTGKYCIAFLGQAATATSATPPTTFTERYDAVTGAVVSYIADCLTYGPVAQADAILQAATTGKYAAMVALKPNGSTPIAFINGSGIYEADASVDAPAPADITDNNVMVAFVMGYQVSGSIPTITPPDGWEVIGTVAVNYIRYTLYWKRCSSESGTYTFSHNGSNTPYTGVVIGAWRNCLTSGTPVDANYSNTRYVTSNTTLRAAAFTPTALTGPWLTTQNGATAARLTPGDTIRIAKLSAPTSVGTCTFTEDSPTITIPANIAQKIDDGETAWTQSTNVTVTRQSTYRVSGSYGMKHAIGALFETGNASYLNIATLNLSGYKQLSMWIRTSVATTAGYLQICLCSDDAGTTPVDTFDIPALAANTWTAVTINKGLALGSAVESIALYVATDFGAVDVYTDWIMACKDTTSADSLTLNSLISDHSTDAPPYYPILQIDGTTLTLGGHISGSTAGPARSIDYIGSSGDKTAYKIEPIQILKGGSNPIYTNESGTATALYKYSGGWNTSSNEQDGYTWFRGFKDISGLYINHDYIEVERVCVTEVSNARVDSQNYVYLHDFQVSRVDTGLYPYSANTWVRAANFYIIGADSYGIGSSSYQFTQLDLSNATILGCVNSGFIATVANTLRMSNVLFRECGGTSDVMKLGYCNARLYNVVSEDKGSTYDLNASNTSIVEGFNCTLPDVYVAASSIARLIKHGQVIDMHKLYYNADTMESEATIRHTASGISWKCTVGASTTSLPWWPARFPITQIAVAASSEVTVSAWLRRTHANLICGLECRGGQIGNVTSDVQDPMTAAADTWEQLTVQFTPDEAGVVEINVYAYGGNYSVYVDDLTISQA
jgi:hypothetical protein